MIRFKLILCCLLSGATLTVEAAPKRAPKAKPAPLPAAVQTQLEGRLGERMNACIRQRVMSEDELSLVAPFKQRDEKELWQSEFWGKWTLGAVGSYRYNRDPELLAKITRGVQAILATQSPDGYIGNYAPDAQLGGWDVWGRKYTMLGLLAYYDLTGDKKSLEGAVKLADHLLTQIPAQESIVRAGYYRGMPPSSVLVPMVMLYNRTMDSRYLDFAKYIVSEWETPDGPQLVSKALADVPVAERFPSHGSAQAWWSWENGQKAYEMMSCYDGLLGLYALTRNADYLKAAEKSVRNIIDEEINITGSGSAGECFYHGRRMQTTPAYSMMETCVTMTWMQLCGHLLELTHDPLYADQIERTVYNALLAALKGDGSQIAKYSPREGVRSPGGPQCGMHVNCCNMNGPRAFAMIPELMATCAADTLFVNLYGESVSKVPLAGGEVILRQQTNYPEQGSVELTVNPRKSREFAVAVRIPAWSKITMVTVNGQAVADVRPGSYLTVSRTWKEGDKIALNFDMRGRLTELNGYQAIERGPVVLARDTRLGEGFVDETCVVQTSGGYVELMPVTDKPAGVWMAFSAPMKLGTDTEGRAAGIVQVPLCDFASAGNTWHPAVRYRVWLRRTFDPISDPWVE